jgi:hypothetical protein
MRFMSIIYTLTVLSGHIMEAGCVRCQDGEQSLAMEALSDSPGVESLYSKEGQRDGCGKPAENLPQFRLDL